MPEALFTAWTNVMDTGRLKPGETFLVHGGTSGIGVIAIQMFASPGPSGLRHRRQRRRNARLCEKLGATRAINYRDEDFVAVMKEATGGKGVDVILDMVGGDLCPAQHEGGGRLGPHRQHRLSGRRQGRARSGTHVDEAADLGGHHAARPPAAEKGAIRDALQEKVWPLVAAGRIRPVVDRRFPLAEAQKAHEFMEKPGATGKLLLIP